MSLKIGSTGPVVIAWQTAMTTRFKSYATQTAADGTVRPLSIDGTFGYPDQAVANEWQRRMGRPLSTDRAAVIVSDDELALLKLAGTPPPATRKRAAAFVWRGTGGVIGEDYVSRVCQGAADLVEEFNPPWAATMGGLPVGTAGGIGDPSMWHATQAAVTAAIPQIRAVLSADSTRPIVLGGYSAGAIVAYLVRLEFEPGGQLAAYRSNFLCGFSFGDPTRPEHGGYYGGPQLDGEGIATLHPAPGLNGWEWCYLAHPDDMYTRVPMGDTGKIMHDAYGLATRVEIGNIFGVIPEMIPFLMQILTDSGISLPVIFGGLGGGIPGLVALALPLLIGMLPGLIAGVGGNPSALTGPAAAAQAAIIALKFLAAGTGPHISYHVNEVWPGQTYLGLAIQHVRDYASRAK